MPKTSAIRLLKRWRAMDRELGTIFGLHVKSFARDWKVSTRTVMRDLQAFRELGQQVEFERLEDRRYCWTYAAGGEWLFVANLPKRLRERLNQPR